MSHVSCNANAPRTSLAPSKDFPITSPSSKGRLIEGGPSGEALLRREGVGVCSTFQPFNADVRRVKPLIQGITSTRYGILNELNLDGIKTSTFITLQGYNKHSIIEQTRLLNWFHSNPKLSGGQERILSNCSVLSCVTQCSQSAAHLHEQFLQVQQIGFVTLGPLRCA